MAAAAPAYDGLFGDGDGPPAVQAVGGAPQLEQAHSQPRPALRSRIVLVTSVPTEVLVAPATAALGPPTLQIVVVPGNPGSAQLYVAFMELLHAAFGGRADIIAVSHAGHQTGAPWDKAWTLDCQVRHKADFLRQHVLLPGRPPAALVAHSIGCHMALHALRELEGAPGPAAPGAPGVEKVILCKPFLRTNPGCPRQAFIRAFAARGEAASALAPRLAAVPEGLKRALLRVFAPGTEPHAVPALLALLGRGSVLNNCVLARHEFVDLDRPVEWDLIRRLGPRAAVIAAPNDMWFPRAHFEEMVAEVPGLQAFFEADLTHAFCVSLYQSGKVARMVRELAAAVLEGAPLAAGGPCRCGGGGSGGSSSGSSSGGGGGGEERPAPAAAVARPRL